MRYTWKEQARDTVQQPLAKCSARREQLLFVRVGSGYSVFLLRMRGFRQTATASLSRLAQNFGK